MKLETLNDRIQKAEEKITKKTATIAKKTATIAKKQAALEKTTDSYEKLWLETDIEGLKDDIERLGKEIEETKKTLESYKGQLSGAIARERTLTVELPESLKALQTELVERWDAYDIEERKVLRKAHSELGYTAFVKKYSYAAYNRMHRTDAEIHKSNMDDAESLILNLVNRVKSTVGEITDWKHVRCERGTYGMPVLNGFIVGKEGRCNVESIGAGGYNIQRYHIRVLVKPC